MQAYSEDTLTLDLGTCTLLTDYANRTVEIFASPDATRRQERHAWRAVKRELRTLGGNVHLTEWGREGGTETCPGTYVFAGTF
jgi:hypothetical protein